MENNYAKTRNGSLENEYKEKVIKSIVESGIDISDMDVDSYNYGQLSLIYECKKLGLDAKTISNPNIPYPHMKQLLEGMIRGFDMNPYVNLKDSEDIKNAYLKKVI